MRSLRPPTVASYDNRRLSESMTAWILCSVWFLFLTAGIFVPQRFSTTFGILLGLSWLVAVAVDVLLASQLLELLKRKQPQLVADYRIGSLACTANHYRMLDALRDPRAGLDDEIHRRGSVLRLLTWAPLVGTCAGLAARLALGFFVGR
jgi:hypothetical protein